MRGSASQRLEPRAAARARRRAAPPAPRGRRGARARPPRPPRSSCRKLGQAVTRLRREVRARVERLAVGGEEDGRRPAALPGHRDRGVHRERVDVGPLLPVDLDVDEEVVHHRRGRRILERLVRHHVAPVAGAVADRDEERAVAAPAPRRTPRPPTGTTRPGCRRAGAGTGSSRRAAGSSPQRVYRSTTRSRLVLGLRSGRRCRIVAPMRRPALWMVFGGGILVVCAVLFQAFTISAYVRGAGEGALDAHGCGSMFVHIGAARDRHRCDLGLVGQLARGRARGRLPRPVDRPAGVPRRHREAGRLDQRPPRLPRAHRAHRGRDVSPPGQARARPRRATPPRPRRSGVDGRRRPSSARVRPASLADVPAILDRRTRPRTRSPTRGATPFHGCSSNCLPPM